MQMRNKKRIIRIILLVLIIVWAILVFSMSNQSGAESSGLSQKIASLFLKAEEQIKIVEPIIRKLAHFSEYVIGGVLFISLFLTYDWTPKKQMTISILLGVWYAILDEIHQLFVPNRSGNIIDVCIDSSGIIFGVCCVMFIYKFYKKQHKKKEGV